MKWDSKKSIFLSKVCILIFIVAAILAGLTAPDIMRRIVTARGLDVSHALVLYLSTFYFLIICGLVALIQLYRLLNNIGSEKIFIDKNVRCLRIISWACYFAGLGSFISVSYYKPYLILAVGAGFMGLILRVVKNVIAEAIQLKKENDYTI